MDDGTSVLFDLPGFRVVECAELDVGTRRVVIMQVAEEQGCPRCGVMVCGKPYDVRESRIKDFPLGKRKLVVVWCKRRYRCPRWDCRQRLFVDAAARFGLAAVRRSGCGGRWQRRRSIPAYSRVAAEYGVSWWLVNDVAAWAHAELPVKSPPVGQLSIEETRTRRVGWHYDAVTGRWRRPEPWMTSYQPAPGRWAHDPRADLGPLVGSGVHPADGAQPAVARRHRGCGDRPVRLYRAKLNAGPLTRYFSGRARLLGGRVARGSLTPGLPQIHT
jgi:hypothetical protein